MSAGCPLKEKDILWVFFFCFLHTELSLGCVMPLSLDFLVPRTVLISDVHALGML